MPQEQVGGEGREKRAGLTTRHKRMIYQHELQNLLGYNDSLYRYAFYYVDYGIYYYYI